MRRFREILFLQQKGVEYKMQSTWRDRDRVSCNFMNKICRKNLT